MALKNWVKENITAGVLATLVAGSLAGAIFTWWVNRPTPTTLAYIATRTSTGADPAALSLVPNLSLRIGDEPIAGIFSHVIELYVRGSYLEKVPLAVTFDRDLRIFGKSLEAPSTLQAISCTQHPRGLTCELSRLDPNQSAPFRISIATETAKLPMVDVVGPNTVLVPLSELEPDGRPWWVNAFGAGLVSVCLVFGVFTVWSSKRSTDRIIETIRNTRRNADGLRERLETANRRIAELESARPSSSKSGE